MRLSVEGFTEKQTRELVHATQFFANLLMHRNMIRNLTIDIERERSLDVQGQVINEDDTKRSRWFTISLRGARGDDHLVKTLAHEMVHVKQYAKNELSKELVVSKGNRVKMCSVWRGEQWTPRRNEDEYWDSPWEIEAFGKEVGLYHRWVDAFY